MLKHIAYIGVIGAIITLSFFVIQNLDSDEVVPPDPVFNFATSTPLVIDARAWGVFDPVSGAVYAGTNIDMQLPIASITKLRTAEVLLQSGLPEATTTITYADVITEGRSGKLQAGEVYTLRTLLFPLLLESSNDAAAAIARVFSTPVFVEQMNVIELPSTTFTDPSGLSSENQSTVKDLARYVSHLFANEQHVLDITMLSQYVHEDIGWINNNVAYHTEGYRGGKQGFTYEAGNTIVALFDMELVGDRDKTFGIIVLDSDDLSRDIQVLRTYLEKNAGYQ